MWLEDCIPLIREIYSYDSTYHDIFRKQVLVSGADVYLYHRHAMFLYFIVPCGIQEKIEDRYIIMTLALSKWSMLLATTQSSPIVWKSIRPHSLSIHYLYNRLEWRNTIRERLKANKMDHLFTMSREDLENLYYYEW
jgi:hypothetical protein